jgi:hypothetical protein
MEIYFEYKNLKPNSILTFVRNIESSIADKKRIIYVVIIPIPAYSFIFIDQLLNH